MARRGESAPRAQQPTSARPTKQAREPKQAALAAGRRIPAGRFRASFGPQHRFRITQRETVGGQTRFYYAGY